MNALNRHIIVNVNVVSSWHTTTVPTHGTLRVIHLPTNVWNHLKCMTGAGLVWATLNSELNTILWGRRWCHSWLQQKYIHRVWGHFHEYDNEFIGEQPCVISTNTCSIKIWLFDLLEYGKMMPPGDASVFRDFACIYKTCFHNISQSLEGAI